MENGLVDARIQSANALADLLAEDPMKNVTTSRLSDFLKQTSDAEVQLFKDLSAKTATAKADFLKGVEDLAAHQADIDSVDQELKALSEKKKPLDAAKDIASFLKDTAQAVQDELDKKKQTAANSK